MQYKLFSIVLARKFWKRARSRRRARDAWFIRTAFASLRIDLRQQMSLIQIKGCQYIRHIIAHALLAFLQLRGTSFINFSERIDHG
jgi:hypothetical protein